MAKGRLSATSVASDPRNVRSVVQYHFCQEPSLQATVTTRPSVCDIQQPIRPMSGVNISVAHSIQVSACLGQGLGLLNSSEQTIQSERQY
jgi:hypothetical protein